MLSAICTLFEGHYHYGVAALTNSLCKQGFKGSIYAGYKGELPSWTNEAKENSNLSWKGAKTLEVVEGIRLHFIPLITEYHLTNYKPDFMLHLWNIIAKDTEALFYFDSDIIVCSPWKFFEHWIETGISLCEDVNSPLERFHPRRVLWKSYYSNYNIDLCFKTNCYFNGGFIGITKAHKRFLDLWQRNQVIMGKIIGNLSKTTINQSKINNEEFGKFGCFNKTDQDALNITVESYDDDISFIGKEAMGFKNGEILMYHTLGYPKSWQIKPILSIFKGIPPRVMDKIFWKLVNNPIKVFPSYLIQMRRFQIIVATFCGRFYSRN